MSTLEDREIARLLGIRARHEGRTPDCVLHSPELRDLCKGRSRLGVRMLVDWFIQGWETQARVEGPSVNRGSIRFAAEGAAYAYIQTLPPAYTSSVRPQTDGHWMVEYSRRVGATEQSK